jgi:hypothetical protein
MQVSVPLVNILAKKLLKTHEHYQKHLVEVAEPRFLFPCISRLEVRFWAQVRRNQVVQGLLLFIFYFKRKKLLLLF